MSRVNGRISCTAIFILHFDVHLIMLTRCASCCVIVVGCAWFCNFVLFCAQVLFPFLPGFLYVNSLACRTLWLALRISFGKVYVHVCIHDMCVCMFLYVYIYICYMTYVFWKKVCMEGDLTKRASSYSWLLHLRTQDLNTSLAAWLNFGDVSGSNRHFGSFRVALPILLSSPLHCVFDVFGF